MTIKSFKGEYFFLSNFFEGSSFIYQGYRFANGEAAFHSQKDPLQAVYYQALRPSEAKRRGRRENLRSDWETVKEQIMFEIQWAKFTQDANLKRKLLATGEQELIEGNWWHDNYWGSCECDCCQNQGKNELGRILMEVRRQLRDEKSV